MFVMYVKQNGVVFFLVCALFAHTKFSSSSLQSLKVYNFE